MTDHSYFTIDNLGLLIAAGMVVIAAGISVLMKLGVAKSLVWSMVRSFVQLLIMGIVLEYVIRQQNVWLVVGLIAIMLIMISIVAELIVRPHPWYAPQVVIPLTGMMLGNTVSALALAMSRFFESMRERYEEVGTLLALGATPWEAARPSVMSSIRLGMLPTIANLASAGIVTIPGMMSGQIIAGGNPLDAARYQFVILTSFSALTLLAGAIILALVYKRCFISYDRYLMPQPAQPLSVRDMLNLRKAVHSGAGNGPAHGTGTGARP